ncbi:MAG: Mu-like prophage major head subunit gpT family protein [Deltaproteobacteria bacterium]|nr:Mu-like prophage major head subunit gpT family protein [Deltaproteobacteria bacterium]
MIINQATLQGAHKTFKVIFNQAFEGAPSQWDLVAMQVPSVGREQGYPWLGDFPTMREWIGDRVIKDLSAFDYTIKNKPYEATIGVDRDDIADDLLGLYNPRIQGLAVAAKEHPDILVFSLLKLGFATRCFDGQYFFDTDHPWGDSEVSNSGGGAGEPWFLMDLRRPIKPMILQMRKQPEFVALDQPDNPETFMRKKFIYGVDDRKNVGFGLWQLAYGSKQTLDETSYAAARAAMMSFKREDGETPLGIIPTHLIHGPLLESAAKKVVDAANKAGGESNIWYTTAKSVNVPWLA